MGISQDLIETNTVPGRSLRKALELAQQAGTEARAVTRQGDIVEEILAEIKEGDYDLVCMGSAYSVHTLRQYYAPNVTAEVAKELADFGCINLLVRLGVLFKQPYK